MSIVGPAAEAVISGCRYPCLLDKEARSGFFVLQLPGPLPINTSSCDGICAFKAEYGTEEAADRAFRDASRFFPIVRKVSPTEIVGHFDPGAARAFYVVSPFRYDLFVTSADKITALVAMIVGHEPRRALQKEASEGAVVQHSTVIAGMREIERPEDMRDHCAGGYLLKVERPFKFEIQGHDWWDADEETIAFLKEVGVTHIPINICLRCCYFTCNGRRP